LRVGLRSVVTAAGLAGVVHAGGAFAASWLKRRVADAAGDQAEREDRTCAAGEAFAADEDLVDLLALSPMPAPRGVVAEAQHVPAGV